MNLELVSVITEFSATEENNWFLVKNRKPFCFNCSYLTIALLIDIVIFSIVYTVAIRLIYIYKNNYSADSFTVTNSLI